MHRSPVKPRQSKDTLTFISHEDTRFKRRRNGAACITCRRRKTRCSGEFPTCDTCSRSNQVCDGYDDQPAGHDKKRSALALGTRSDAPGHGVYREQPAESASPSYAINETRHFKVSAAQTQWPAEEPSLGLPGTANTYRHPNQTYKSAENETTKSSEAGVTPPQVSGQRNWMPYFRYFGPTAIVPGFKQMVVEIRRKHSVSHSDGPQAPLPPYPSKSTPSAAHHEVDPSQDTEFDPHPSNDVSLSPLIIHLCDSFFATLGCTFPFLQKDRFMRDLHEQRVEPILVDAVCAVAARISTPSVTGTGKPDNGKGIGMVRPPIFDPILDPMELSEAFARRAKSAIWTTFACPNVAIVQASLLLANSEFGAARDSGLWVFLGISIRMAQDLGMQKLEGLKFEGRSGCRPTRITSSFAATKSESMHLTSSASSSSMNEESIANNVQDQRQGEKERVDTFWALFFLDRAISSGTGRPVTLKAEEIELSMSSIQDSHINNEPPSPFAVLISVIDLYGTFTDLLNGINNTADVTNYRKDLLEKIESRLTHIYQGLSPRLHFNAVNFKHYVEAGEGPSFVLLHFWFHALVIVLHQPTLIQNNPVYRLLPHNRELSMSSAKTIADILAFAELIDIMAVMSHHCTSQPIYIAACAFLSERAIHTLSDRSRRASMTTKSQSQDAIQRASSADARADNTTQTSQDGTINTAEKLSSRHILLANAANQNYERCYQAMQSLGQLWDGVKYMITVLDQKAQGIKDPLLYSKVEIENSLEAPTTERLFNIPGWRRTLFWDTGCFSTENNPPQSLDTNRNGESGPGFDPATITDGTDVIGWSLTGVLSSPNGSLALLYPRESQKACLPGLQNIPPSASVQPIAPNTGFGKYSSPLASSGAPIQSSRLVPHKRSYQGATQPLEPTMSYAGPTSFGSDQSRSYTSTQGVTPNPHEADADVRPTGSAGFYADSWFWPEPGAAQCPDPNVTITAQDINVLEFWDDVAPWLAQSRHDFI